MMSTDEKVNIPSQSEDIASAEELKNLISARMSTTHQKVSITCLLASIAFLSSCNSMKKSLSDEGYKDPAFYSISAPPRASMPGNFYSWEAQLAMDGADDALFSHKKKQWSTYRREIAAPIRSLQRKRKLHPKQAAHYDSLLQIEHRRFLQERAERVENRIAFLKMLYADLFSSSTDDFTNKYKNHFSTRLQHKMLLTYRGQHNNTDGYAWGILADGQMHMAEDFAISHLCYDDCEQFPERQAMLMRSSQLKKEKWPYPWFDFSWYSVKMGEYTVMLQLVGTGSDIVVIGLINPLMKVSIGEQL